MASFKRWFSNLRVSQKLTLISVFFVMPDSVMLYLFITAINANIQVAELEMKGNEYQRPLEVLLELLPQHRLLVDQLLEGDQSLAPAVKRKEIEIDKAFNALEGVDERIGVELQFTDEGLAKRNRQSQRPRMVWDEWAALKRGWAKMKPEASAKEHQHLIADVRTMITHAGDTSNLILDPDLDSYYLMDATLLALPQTQDRMAEVVAYALDVIQKGTETHQDRQQFAIFATMLKESDLDRILNSVKTAVREDPNFYGESPTLQARVPPALDKYREAAEKFIKMTNRFVYLDQIDVTAEEYLQAGKEAEDASFNLWRIADEEVDVLLHKRIESYENQRARSLLVAGCVLLAAIGFVTFITRSISGPLRQQAVELRGANDALQAQIAERRRAEEELRRNEEQLAKAQHIAGLGSWEWVIEPNEMIWSEENSRIHGFAPHEFQPTYESALDLVHPDERKRSDLILKRALADGKPFSFEQRILRHDGTERILHQQGEAVRTADGKVTMVVGTAQDVTERKRAEEELENVHKELLGASRQAGMAEVATGVLHNVGNVLNSVNVSAMLISERIGKSRVAHLASVSALLREHAGTLAEFLTNDPKGKKLPDFIHTLSERLAAEQADLQEEAAGLVKNISHMKDIVAVQQSYAKVSGIVETLPADGLVNDALQMNASAMERHQIDVVREFHETPPVQVDKHKVLQILINVIRNAKYAMSESATAEKRMRISIGCNGSGRVKIAISDNGIGIPSENLARIFGHGFTTKPDGHGFGLHTSALAANEMGGSLTAQSDGLGRGATFTLELPIEAPKTNPNAS